MVKEYRRCLWLALLALVLASGAALAQELTEVVQTPAEAVADVVATSGIFPEGTAVVSVTVNGNSAIVELSPEAAPPGLSDGRADDMVRAVVDALATWPEISAFELVVAGQPLWKYLPESSAPMVPGPGISVQSAMSVLGVAPLASPPGTDPVVPALTDELAGKKIALHPSHGTYYVNVLCRATCEPADPPWWNRSQRTLCGPNPSTRPPGWTGSTYHPSNYYYYTRGFQWPSMYEDEVTPEVIRFLASYVRSSGATAYVSRDLDKDGELFDPLVYGYLPSPFEMPMWMMATMYNLRAKGYPQWIWDEPTLPRDYDKDIRARPYYANYVGADLSLSLHSNATGANPARGTGTEVYWYTSKYPELQPEAIRFAGNVQNGVVNALRNYFDDYGPSVYPYSGSKPQEWGSPAYTKYTNWFSRGVKTGNYGEVREAMMPAVLMEIAFHDQWKFYPDNLMLQDPIWQSAAAWGLYEGICAQLYATPKPRLAASVASVDLPTLVGPGAAINGTISMQNEGMAWCWGMKWASMVYGPYTPWKLAATADDQFGVAGTKIDVAQGEVAYPGDTSSFAISLTAPTTTGLYTTAWQMLKDDAKGGAFGAVASAQIQVDADAPEITITSPAAQDYAYGCVSVAFSAADALSQVATLTAEIDGTPVTSGQTVCNLALGSHTLTVVAADTFGNTATQSVTFNIVNTVGKVSVGGWIELLNKKATCGFECEYVEGASAPTGHLTYQDHDTGMTVQSDAMLAIGIVGNHAWFYGTCTIDGEAGHWFRVDVIDNGEPGSADVFNISLDTGYSQGGTLGGGNVTIH